MNEVRRFLSSWGTFKLCAIALVGGLAVGLACGGPNGCRGDPYCGGGGVGAFCDGNSECAEGYCCDKKECAHGMCTFRCEGNGECPNDMACEHGNCLFRCGNGGDCLNGQKCKHDGVCEWD